MDSQLGAADNGATPLSSGEMVNPRLIATFQSASEILSLLVLLLGVSVLIGWVFGIAPLKSVFPGSVTMKVNTALSFVLLSASLWMVQTRRADSPVLRLAARLCSTVAILIGSLTLLEYIGGRDLGIDQLFIKEPPGALFTVHLGRPALMTALNIALTGLAILGIDARGWRGTHLSQVLSATVAMTSLLSLLSHLFNAPILLKLIPGSTAMAFHTALGFIVLSAAIILARPERGVVSILISDTAGGILMRRMFFPSVIFMIVLDYATDTGAKAGLYDKDSETVIHGALLMVFFSYIILMTARLLRDADIERHQSVITLSESEARFRQLFQQASDYILVLEPVIDGPPIIVDASDSAFEKHGYAKVELLGKPITFLDAHVTDVAERMKILASGIPLTFEAEHGRKDGSTFFVEVNAKIVSISGKRLLYTIERDISDRLKAEAVVRLHSDILRNLSEGVYLIRVSDGAIVFTNERFDAMFGYNPGELLGKHVSQVNAPGGNGAEAVAKGIMDELGRTGVWNGEVRNVKKDGAVFWCSARVTTFTHPEFGKVWVSVHEDITNRKAAEEALIESQTLLKTVLELLPVGVWIQNAKGELVYGNQASQRIWAGSRLVGIDQFGEYKGWWLHSGKLIEPHEWAAARAIEKGETSLDEEILIQCFDGTKKIILNSVIPLFKNDASIDGAICVNQDITDLKRTEDELNRFFNLVPDMICIASTDGYFLKVNPVWEKVLGYTMQELRATPFVDFIHPDDRESTMNEVARQIEGEATIEFINRYRCKDGNYRWLEWVAAPSPDRKQLYAAARDITERKEAQEKVVKAKDVAEAATLMKDKFLSLVSHDLKAPLSAMIGFLKLVRDDSAARLDEGAKLILANAIGSGISMASLIDDLLNVSRIRTGSLKLRKQFFDAKYLGVMMASNYSYLAGQKGIDIANLIPDNSRIYADRTLLTEAVQNLITNAIKFCKKGDLVTISLSPEDATTICVKDTGPGIPPERLDNLFDYTMKTSTKGTDGEAGSGLGLPLVKDIMELHGGTLDVQSELDKGSLFSLKLPYVRPKILIVDDDRNFRYLQMHLLKDMNTTIIEAEDGEEALKMMESSQPHLVISDIKMPVMDGLELIRQLKANPLTKEVPVIMVSGEYGMEIRDTVFKLGAEDFVTKDKIDKMDFFPRVRRFIG